jgi:group II intron reverse transcriptase/maturase
MQKADVVLNAIRKRGTEGKPLQRVYRQLFNRQLYLLAYGRIYRNAGATTPGSDAETVDGMSLERIEKIINLLRHERYDWKPVRRVYIEKKNSTKKRPLGIPGWSDKLVQEVIRLMLEAYYEPQFSIRSHGFRPNRGCGTALQEILHKWDGTKWFIEGDIKGCFDNINHATLMDILAEKVQDNRFLRLIAGALKAGYLEDWRWNPSLSGTPQGGIITP